LRATEGLTDFPIILRALMEQAAWLRDNRLQDSTRVPANIR
jgi:hypothetical protein